MAERLAREGRKEEAVATARWPPHPLASWSRWTSRHDVPGRSWKGLAETLLMLMPPLDIADLGAGEATFTQFLARRARPVLAVDNSEKW